MNLSKAIYNRDITEYNNLVSRLSRALVKDSSFNIDKYAVYKSGVSKQRIPLDRQWVYYRAAAMLLRSVQAPRSVNYFRKHFGSMKNRGVEPDKKYKASGFIVRHVLQQLELTNYVTSREMKGRYATEHCKQIIRNLINETK